MKRYLGILVVLSLFSGVLLGDTYYVNGTTGDDSWDGTAATYQSGTIGPKATIQSGINVAILTGDTVIVGQGTYTGPGNRDIDYGGKAITVRSEDPTDPNVVDATIIDCQGTQAEPHRGFIFQSDEGADSILEGLTITNGFGHLLYFGGRCGVLLPVGGGIFCNFSNPMIRYCSIRDNIAIEGVAGGSGDINCAGTTSEGNGYGGGIYCISPTSLTISYCRIMNNSAGVGGGIYTEGSANILMNNCIISNNVGAGIASSVWNDSIATIRDCIIENNSDGGIVVSSNEYTSTIYNCTNCTIANNAGTGIAGNGYEMSLLNSIVWGNGGLEIDLGTSSTASVSYSNVQGGAGAVGVGTSSTLNWLDGNIDADPNFVDSVNGNYHLQNSSPCIDTGDHNFVPEPNEVDIDDDPRIIRGLVDMGADEFIPTCYTGPDYDQWASVDYPPSWCNPRQCHGDADNNEQAFGSGRGSAITRTGSLDLAILAATWNVQSGADLRADFDHAQQGFGSGRGAGLTRTGSLDMAVLAFWYNNSAVPGDCQSLNPAPNQ